MIEALIFDLGGVFFTDGNRVGTDRVSERLGQPRAAVVEVLSGALGKRYREGAISRAAFWAEAQHRWGTELTADELAAIWHSGYAIRPAMAQLVDTLRNAGYRVVFLSDNTPERSAYLEAKTQYLRHFDGGVFSFDHGETKPSDLLYERVLTLCACAPPACVYVDDKAHLLTSAEALGMHTVHFVGVEPLVTELRRLELIPVGYRTVENDESHQG